MNDLIKELREWRKDFWTYYGVKKTNKWLAALDKILSRHSKDTEPLEELAKRKDKSISVCVVICCNELFQEAEFDSETKARQYLNGLPDVKGRGR